MSNAVVPINQITKTFPEAGRIRLGIKSPKGYPQSIDTFRLTSQYEQPLEQAAELWGGTVGRWNDQYEVVTETNQVPIILPLGQGFDPLGGTPVYELWTAGGCTRRCDGETACTPETTGPDTVEMVESACICAAKGILECKPKLRLIVGLPDLDFYGFWRLETGSMYAIKENQAMLETIAMLQTAGIHRGVLTLERREAKKPGATTKKFVVPVLRLAGSMNELQSGATSLGALATAAPRPELAAGESPPSPAAPRGVEASPSSAPLPTSGGDGVEGEAAPSPSGDTVPTSNVDADEDIVDAEIVDDDESTEVVDGDQFRLDPQDRARFRAAFMARIKGLGLSYDDHVKPWLEHKYGGGWSDLSDKDAHELYAALIVPDGTRQQKDDRGEKFKTTVLEHLEAQA